MKIYKYYVLLLSVWMLFLCFGCQGSMVFYPLKPKDNKSGDAIVGKWQGAYNNKTALIDVNYDDKREIYLINVELKNSGSERSERLIPLQGSISIINDYKFLNVDADIDLFLKKHNYSDASTIFYCPSIYILKILFSENNNTLTVYVVNFAEQENDSAGKIKGLSPKAKFINDRCNILLNDSDDLVALIKNNQFRVEKLITLQRCNNTVKAISNQ